MRDFTKTREALALYDAKLAVFNSDTFSRMRNGEAMKFFIEMQEMEREVCRQFIAATSDVNSPDKANVIGVGPWLRKMVQ